MSRGTGRGALIEGEGAALAFSLCLAAAVLWPVRENWRAGPRDSFPLSYYPMFAARRRKHLKVTHLVGHDAQGARHTLSYSYVADGGLNQVRKQISRAVKAGQADALCALAATRVAERPRSTHPPLTSVSVVTCEYALAEWFTGARAPWREDVHASRPVAAGSSAPGLAGAV